MAKKKEKKAKIEELKKFFSKKDTTAKAPPKISKPKAHDLNIGMPVGPGDLEQLKKDAEKIDTPKKEKSSAKDSENKDKNG